MKLIFRRAHHRKHNANPNMRETLEQACDDSSRPKVEAMFYKIVAKTAADTKSQATNVFEKYQSSYQVERVSLLVQNVTEAFRLRGRSLMGRCPSCHQEETSQKVHFAATKVSTVFINVF